MARYVNEYHTPKDPVLDPSHIHGYYEIYLNLTGDISFLVNNHIYAVQHGDMILTRPGDVHVCILNSPCVHEHVCLWLDMPLGHALAEGFEENGAALWRPQGEARERLIASSLLLLASAEQPFKKPAAVVAHAAQWAVACPPARRRKKLLCATHKVALRAVDGSHHANNVLSADTPLQYDLVIPAHGVGAVPLHRGHTVQHKAAVLPLVEQNVIQRSLSL